MKHEDHQRPHQNIVCFDVRASRKCEKKRESNPSLLALYLVFFLLPFFFFPVGFLDTIATSNLELSAISPYIISYARATLNTNGVPVGQSYTSGQRWKQKVPFIKGLYCAGHWFGPSGIYNVTLSCKNAATLILKEKRQQPTSKYNFGTRQRATVLKTVFHLLPKPRICCCT